MHRIRINKESNRLYLTLSGIFDLNSANSVIHELTHEVKKLKPEFNVISDIKNVHPANVYVLKQIGEGTKILEDNGAKYIIRVVGASKYALTIFAKFSNFTKKTKIYYVPTLEEAETKLTELENISTH